MYSSNALNQYKNNSVNYAPKGQLLLMLLDGAVKFSKVARQAIVDKDISKANENIKKTQSIFYELIATLDLTLAGNWGKGLVAVYQFIINRLLQANIRKDVKIIDEVIPLIEEVRETWQEAYYASKR